MLKLISTKLPLLEPFLKLNKSQGTIAQNILWLMIERVLKLIVGVLVGVWMARYLGPEQFGQLNYVIAFTALVIPISNLGLDSIVVRDIVNKPAAKNDILGTAFLLRLASGLVAQIVIIILYFCFSYNDGIYKVIMPIITAGIVFKAFEVIDFWFQSQVLSKNVVNVRLLSFFIISAMKIILIWQKATLLEFSVVVALEILLDAVALVGIYLYTRNSISKWRFSLTYAKKLLIQCWPMAISSVSVMLYMKIDQVMIGKILGDSDLGIYSAATRISEIWYFIPGAIVSSLTPSIVKAKQMNESRYLKKNQSLLDLCTLLAYVLALPMTFLSNFIILLLYGSEYKEAGLILAIHIWSAVFVFLGAAKNPWIISEGHLKINSTATAIACLVNIGLNFILLPTMGVVGAAVATLISYGIANFFIFLLSVKTKVLARMMIKALLLKNFILIFRKK
ncbi:flippase [Paenibacillus sp. OV219]|uniref:flippase n=1 Tax=Paenibacillus sp. OV219 TaxID=1884377 RepID=UPI0008D830CB|nr:flippase [Paenibacillus sp. OV219]SEN61459.1 polysaccharide transporter, PST family [Paenibacillus sp. OV219]